MVYLRVSVTSSLHAAMLYAGATSDNVQGRFVRKKLSYFERALKVFHRKCIYYTSILIGLHHDSDGLSLLATD